MLSAGCPAPAAPLPTVPPTPGRPGCSWTACSSLAASADRQAHGSWARRQQESMGTHASGRLTPPGRSHFLLADGCSASARVCFGLEASVYNLSPGRTGIPQKGFTEAGQCLLSSFVPCAKAVLRHGKSPVGLQSRADPIPVQLSSLFTTLATLGK